MQAVNESGQERLKDSDRIKNFFKKVLKNLLTNVEECGIIQIHASHRVDEKNFQKTFEKPLDKGKGMWYNSKAVQNTAVSKETIDH